MNKEFKIYHTETQEDYDDLMIKLEKEGCMWTSESLPTSEKNWNTFKGNTYIALNENSKRLTYGYMGLVYSNYPDIPVIKYKSKGVKQMEKVVVPQFVADWYEGYRHKSLRLVLNHLMNCRDQRIMEWVDKNSPSSAQEIIAKMHLFQDYEVEEKKYYWRKKKECLCDFEEQDYMYLNVHKGTGTLAFGNTIEISISRTLFTETEVKQLVSKEDFNKLEKVEIADDEC